MALYMPLFKACTNLRSLTLLHAHLTVTGLQNDHLASTKLIESYSQMGSVQTSRLVFDRFPNPDSFMWGVLIKCYVWNGLFQEAIFVYQNMLERLAEPNKFVFPSVLRACSAINDLRMGEKVHARIVKSGFESDPVVETTLLSVYGETGRLYDARRIFDAMSMRDVVSWSSIISTYVQNGQASEGLEIFRKMVVEGMEIDSVTMLSVAEACAELGLWRVGKSSHGYVVRRNIGSDHEALGSSLVAMYGKFGDLCSAEKLFRNGVYQSVTSWTAMISSYNQNGCYLEALGTFIEMLGLNVESYAREHMVEEALSLFVQMLIEGIMPDSFALASALSACGMIGLSELGCQIHCLIIKTYLPNEFVENALIDVYSKCGFINSATRVFIDTQQGSVITWNSIMCGFSQNGYSKEALSLFDEMYAKHLDMMK
ncbi:putative pentatricopeptide repeat-containing protein, mitochondrial [Sesamum angolense]|uniref:Pentatricopeptide repeat-containing protein, mitochondrial n=1 Tax=Sesamum angolense TaxID=2727404 RepID=A0AAE1X0G9_9LAMI|nr:putative pentatricopeptide repeat-containing protein, mitochondrial [Sesamum angolense]